MKIERATVADVYQVALNMRDRDFEEFSAVSHAATRGDLADILAKTYGDRDDVLCGFADDIPVCIGGTLEGRPNVITLLFFATDDFAKIALPLTRFIRANLFPRYFAAGVHRIEAVAMASHTPIHSWLQALGLSPETSPLEGYGKNGEAFIQFSKVLVPQQPDMLEEMEAADVRPAGA